MKTSSITSRLSLALGVQRSITDDPNNADHLIRPEDAISAAWGRQEAGE